tara:strand:- start:457 stop:594 length:138 start_codon:yes stop_codon:yes gene_type:complete
MTKMSNTDPKASDTDFNEADSKADAIAIFCLIIIAAGAMIFLATG